jgi:hypothetical protein
MARYDFLFKDKEWLSAHSYFPTTGLVSAAIKKKNF